MRTRADPTSSASSAGGEVSNGSGSKSSLICDWIRATTRFHAHRPLLDHYVVIGPHDKVRTGGANFHMVARKLVKEVGRAPAIDQFTFFVQRHVFGRSELRLFRIVAHDGRHDLRIRSN